MEAVDKILRDPRLHDILSIVKGCRNGLVYGTKVRFPHALIMTLLFQQGRPWRQRLAFVLRATRQHALNLAKFVGVYKTALVLQKAVNKGQPRPSDTFFAGLVGGWLVFGDRNPVNEQIVLYVVSRVVTSFLPRDRPAGPVQGGKPLPPNAWIFKVYAALSWAMVMYLFRVRRETLQSGMVNSMQYLYLDSNSWGGLKTFIWHNK